MINKLRSRLQKPFPFYETLAEKLLVPLYISLFIVVFELVFNPSKNTEIFSLQLLKIFNYALITFVIASSFNLWLPKILPRFFESEKWTIGKMILFSLIKVLIISLVNATYAFYVDVQANDIYFPFFLLRVTIFTISVAIIPVVVIILWLEKRFYKKNYRLAISTSSQLKELKPQNLTSETFEHNDFRIELNQLYYIKSDGNYCSFFYEDDNSMVKTLIRITLKEIEKKIIDRDNFIRCHKSYIVNLQKISKVVGNARQYNVFLDNTDISVPVSRNLSKPLIERFSLTQ